MAATLIYWHKARIHKRFVVELKIHDVGRSAGYPDGLKYGLICYDLKTNKKVLMDNHHPKGPHIHIEAKEVSYEFVGPDRLIEDFKRLVFEHMGVKL
ncbi:MAG: hypothetical protein EA369_07145 [Bradymonadales bacterium]|nr:MAG: hypothetical protein EA369_07145 [Bradymonadales bacterium]